MNRLVTLFLAGAIGVAAAPSAGCGQAPSLESGPQTVNVNGQDRNFIVRVPEGYDNNNPYRLIFGVHWWGGSMEDVAYGQTVEPGVWNYYGLERLAEETAIFVAPQGIDGNWYNDGGSDYAFFDEINRLVEGSLCVDTDLRFSIGFSWGGSTSVGIACRDGEFPFRAITAIAAAGPFECKIPTDVSHQTAAELTPRPQAIQALRLSATSASTVLRITPTMAAVCVIDSCRTMVAPGRRTRHRDQALCLTSGRTTSVVARPYLGSPL